LRQLVQLRTVAISGQVVGIAIATALGVALPLMLMFAVVGCLAALCAMTWQRLARPDAVSCTELATHLAADLVAFTVLLALAGGLHNPFAILFLLHTTLVVLLLPLPVAACGVGAIVVCVAALVGVAPLHLEDGGPLGAALLARGTMAAFALSAVVLAWFVARIVGGWRDDARELAAAALRAQNTAAVMRIGALAAGAAHELATPLMTIAVIAGEMRRQAATPEAARDAELLTAQVDACRSTLGTMMAVADHAQEAGGEADALDTWLECVIAQFRTTRPGIPVAVAFAGSRPGPVIVSDVALKQTLLILLNNAADASPHAIEVGTSWDASTLTIAVADRGPGFPPEHLARLGRAFFTTKPPGKGTGLGLVLAISTIERFGGDVVCSNRPDGGAHVVLRLPLHSLQPQRKS
jgi:two-component system sensor histidine kinase RegB